MIYAGLYTLLLRPLQPAVRERLEALREGAGILGRTSAGVARAAAEGFADSAGLEPLAAFDLPRLMVAAMLLGAGLLAARNARRRWTRTAAVDRLGWVGLVGLLLLGAVHTLTNLLDLWDVLIAGGSVVGGVDAGAEDAPKLLADTKALLGVLACLGVSAWLWVRGRARRAAVMVAGVAAVIADIWLYSFSGEERGWGMYSPLVQIPTRLFSWAFDHLYPELAGAGPLLFDDLVLEGAMIELLVYNNLAAGLWLLAMMSAGLPDPRESP